MVFNLNYNDVYEYGKLILIFVTMFSIGDVLYKFRQKYILFILIMGLTFPLHYLYGLQSTSIYKDLNLVRSSNQSQFKSHFRKKGREILQNVDDEDKDEKYAQLQDQIEILSDKNKRIFYDKFDKIFENQDFDGKEFKEIYSVFLKNKIFDIVNFSFFWIIFLFILGKGSNNLQLTNIGMKFVFFWTFLLVYYIYQHELESKSWLDYYFPYQTVAQQVIQSQIIFATYLGLLCSYVQRSVLNKKKLVNERLQGMREQINKLNLNDFDQLKRLQSQLKSYQDFNNKKQLI